MTQTKIGALTATARARKAAKAHRMLTEAAALLAEGFDGFPESFLLTDAEQRERGAFATAATAAEKARDAAAELT